VLRILPPYYLCLGAFVAFSGHFIATGDRLDTVLHLAFLHNLREESFYSLSPNFWTLAVQAQAYVWLPLVIVLTLRASSSWNRRAILLAALVAASYGIHWATLTLAPGHAGIADWAASRPTVATHSLFAHAPHFLLGLLAGLVYVRRISSAETPASAWAAALREVAVCAAVVVILLILSTPLDDWFSIPYGRYNFPVVPLLITWLILEIPRTRLARSALDFAPLHWLGVISFGVYVYHYLCLLAVGAVMERAGFSAAEHWAMFGATSLVLTIVVAGLSFVALERPIARLARPREGRQRAAVLTAW
jgi:peptidoglycan/LPS O-acetylase OafA/YrhL